jgi:hypothetical protein
MVGGQVGLGAAPSYRLQFRSRWFSSWRDDRESRAKYWKPKPPLGRDVVEQLIRGIENNESGLEAELGIVITSGTIGSDAIEKAREYGESTGKRIELIDGELLAKLIVERGLQAGYLQVQYHCESLSENIRRDYKVFGA